MKKRLIVWAYLVIAIILGIVAFFGFITYQTFFGRTDPRTSFETLVTKPIPDSVHSLEEGSFFAMDSVLRVLRFQISPADLRELLEKQHFTPADEREEFAGFDQKSADQVQTPKDEYFKRWQRTIESSTKLRVSFSGNWQIYALKEGRGQKRIFFEPNNNRVIFVAYAN